MIVPTPPIRCLLRILLVLALVVVAMAPAFSLAGQNSGETTGSAEAPAQASQEDHFALGSDPIAEIEWQQVWRRYGLTIVAVGALIVLLAAATLALLAGNRRQRRLRLRARRLNQRLAELSRNVPGVLYQFRRRADGSSHFPFASEGLFEIYGCRPEDVVEDATPAFGVLHPDDLDDVSRSIEESAQTLATWHLVYRVNHPARGTIWVQGSATPTGLADGSVVWHGYIRDITDLQMALERARTAASVFEASNEGIVISDADYHFRDVNSAFEDLTGYSQEDVVGCSPEMLLPDQDRARIATAIRTAMQTDGQWKGEVVIARKQGDTVPAELSISTVFDDDGRVSHYVTLLSDISLRKAHEQWLGDIASHDALTGIGNRRQVEEKLERAVTLARAGQGRFALGLLDLDGFKPINDRYGHDAGDTVLATIARRLDRVLRAGDFVGRLGGDEFVLILNDPQGETAFERILEVVRSPVDIDTGRVSVTASMGVTYCNADNPADADTLMRRADRALYQSKSAGRDRYTINGPEDAGDEDGGAPGAD